MIRVLVRLTWFFYTWLLAFNFHYRAFVEETINFLSKLPLLRFYVFLGIGPQFLLANVSEMVMMLILLWPGLQFLSPYHFFFYLKFCVRSFSLYLSSFSIVFDISFVGEQGTNGFKFFPLDFVPPLHFLLECWNDLTTQQAFFSSVHFFKQQLRYLQIMIANPLDLVKKRLEILGFSFHS